MEQVLESITGLLILACAFAWLNQKWLNLPRTLALLVASLISSLFLVGFHAAFPQWLDLGAWQAWIHALEFEAMLMDGMLIFLLFAGALHIDLESLAKNRGLILSTATVGVVMNSVLVGTFCWGLFALMGVKLSVLTGLLFGAIVAPTDPIAVLALMKKLKAPESMQIKVAGESLFNDGVGVVVFSLLVVFFKSGDSGSDIWQEGAKLFATEVFGGIALGLFLGLIFYRAMKSVDDANLEIMLSFCLVCLIGMASHKLHVSGPLGAVVGGLLIGNKGRVLAMSAKTREHLDVVWGFLDEFLNAVLFLMLGLISVDLGFTVSALGVAFVLWGFSLLARGVSLWPMLRFFTWRGKAFDPGTFPVMVWGGLKGGISVALALSLPKMPDRNLLIQLTYGFVIFSVLIQGLSMGSLLKRYKKAA